MTARFSSLSATAATTPVRARSTTCWRMRRRTNAVIYAVILAGPDDEEARPGVLKTLANETGGTAFSPKAASGHDEIFTRIALEMRSGYTIGFSPSRGRFGRVSMSVQVVAEGDHRQLTVRTRAGYYAGPTPHAEPVTSAIARWSGPRACSIVGGAALSWSALTVVRGV